MYLARMQERQKEVRYVIRQSYADGDCYRSRDLFDLGKDPGRFIIYPGGNGFYIDPVVEEAIEGKGVTVSQEDIEPVFMPFLPFHIRRVIDGFDRRRRMPVDFDGGLPADLFHRFDQYRLQYLKLGRVTSGNLKKVPGRFYAPLHKKSRDEIEYDFISAERILKTKELARYTFQIFDLHRHFSASFARNHPESLDQQRLDHFFLKALCNLNEDTAFWAGCNTGSGLNPHLIRYAVMYFDNAFLPQDPFRHFLRDFMNRHRIHRPPESVQISLAESARLFGVTVDTIKKMDGSMLTRTYRKLAMKHHPDKGGDPETFVKLSEAYNKLMKRTPKSF